MNTVLSGRLRRRLLGCALGAALLTPAWAQGQDQGETTGLELAQARGTEVIEVSTRTPRSLFETPAAVGVVDGAYIQLLQPVGFQEVFDTVPGVEIMGGARRIAEEPSIRGFSDTQIILRVDGARRNFDLAHRGRFLLDPELVKRIEVMRGSSSTLYGSGGLGGVIDVETVDASDLLGPGETVGGRIKLGYQSNGQEPLVSGGLYTVQGRWDILTHLVYRETTEDLEDGAGDDILDSQDRIFNGLAKLGFAPTDHQHLELFVNVFDSAGQNPTNAQSESSPETLVDRDTRAYDARLSYSYRPDTRFIDLTAVAYYTDLEVREDRIIDGRLDVSDFESWGIDIKNIMQLLEGEDASLRLAFGAEVFGDSQSGTRDGADRTQFPDAERTFAAGYAQLEWDLFGDLIDIVPGIRFDHFDLEAEGGFPDRSEGEVSPRVSIGLRPTEDIYIWASWARAFRAPSLTELYVDGIHFTVPLGPDPQSGVDQLVVNEFIPSPDLEPEVATSYEIGARYGRQGVFLRRDRLDASISYFHTDVDDFIDQRVVFISGRPSFTPPFGPLVFPGSTVNSNLDAEIHGLEGELLYEADGWLFSVSGHWIDAENRDTGEGLGSILQNRLALRLERSWHQHGLRLGAKLVAGFDKDDVPADVEPGEGYETLDLYAAWQPQTGVLRGTRFGVGIDNVTDADFAVFPMVIRQPGRSFRLSVSRRFSLTP